MFKSVAFVLMIALATPVAAQNSAPAQPAAPSASKGKDPNRVICEREEEIGTRLGGKKICKTAAQWQEERQQERQTLEKFQQQSTSTAEPGGAI